MRSVDEWITSDQGVGCVGMMGERDVERGVIWRVRASFSCKNKPWNREGKSVVKRGSEMRVSLNYRGLDGRIHKRGQKKSEQRMGCCEGKKKMHCGPKEKSSAGTLRYKSAWSVLQARGWEGQVWAWGTMVTEAKAENERVAADWKAY